MTADTEPLTAPALTPETLAEFDTLVRTAVEADDRQTGFQRVKWMFEAAGVPALIAAARASDNYKYQLATIAKASHDEYARFLAWAALDNHETEVRKRIDRITDERDAALKRAEAAEKALKRIGNISVGHPVSWAHSIVREVLPDFVRDTHVG